MENLELIFILIVIFALVGYGDKIPQIKGRDKILKDIDYLTLNQISYGDLSITGETIIIQNKTNAFMFFKTGLNSISDSTFHLSYSVMNYSKRNGDKLKYITDVKVNDTSIDGQITNSTTAAKILVEMFYKTKGKLFNDSNVGKFFMEMCSYLFIFNKNNNNRTFNDYTHLESQDLSSFIDSAYKEYLQMLNVLNEKAKIELHISNNLNHQQDFEIYLKLLEFEDINNLEFSDIKEQYIKLALKYNLDKETSDAKRFELITQAYEYLKQNYPQ